MTGRSPPHSTLEVDIEKASSISNLSLPSIISSTYHHGSSLHSPNSSIPPNLDDNISPAPATTEATQLPKPDSKLGTALKSTLSRISTKSSWKDPGPPPDGGLKAWTQVLMGHLVIMNTWGFINSFGVFQSYYVHTLARPPSDIAWVGSIQTFLLFFIGTFSGRLTDAGFFRPVFATGCFLSVFGIFMASLSTKYYHLFLAQGVCCGLGNGLIFTPTVSLVSTYFSSKRSLAIGIAAAGSATGGLIYPVMVQQLLPSINFPWTMRSLGFVQLGCLLLCNILASPRLPPRRAGPAVEWAAFKEIPYSAFAIGMFFTFWGVYFAFFYLGSFARDIIGLPYATSINLILVLNGVGAVGRLLPNWIADRYVGPLNVMIPVCLVSAVISYTMIAVRDESALYVWAAMYGTFGAAIQSLFPAILAGLTSDLRKRGTRMGMVFTIVSFAVLTGPPIAGQLIVVGHGGYVWAQCFAATSVAVGMAFMFVGRISKTGWTLRAKM